MCCLLGCQKGCSSKGLQNRDADRVARAGLASAVRPSPGCARQVNDVSSRSIAIDARGLRRSYYFALPEHYDPNVPHALVLGFHGSGANGEAMRSHLDMEALAGGSAIFAYPDGLEVGDEAGLVVSSRWRARATQLRAPGDLGVLR